MIKRFTIRDIRVTFTVARIVRAGGFNSLLTDGNHILMFDFDKTTLEAVESALKRVQRKYRLPRITILETREGTNFIAYCFRRVPLKQAVTILSEVEGLDWGFFKFGVYRGKFTLRVTDKGYGKPRHVKTLLSSYPEDATILDLATWVNYQTLKD
ncbi:hypothetical protein ES708_08982 [subsurface metagenome]